MPREPTRPSPHPPARRRTRLALALDADGVDHLCAVTGAVGRPEFYGAVLSFLRSLIDAEVGIALRYWTDQRPQYVTIQAAAALRRGAREAVYIDGPYVLDPVYQLFQRGVADGAHAMSSYVPDDFYESEFYQCFFRNTRLVDTIDVLWRIDSRSSMALCLGREEGTPPFAEAELALVRHVLPLVFAAMRRHHEIALPVPHDEDDRRVHRKVETTMANFGASLLTKREREVVFYMLSGYSSEQTAERLNTAEGTIRNQRKSIHRKLETSSQAELFSLFIQCIPFAEPDSDVDPLVRFQGPRAASEI
jgi:DNA-binding CsgD family transcriptional regulator